jgi:hypothetical protein
MASIIPFEGGALPAYLQTVAPEGLNDDLTAHAGAGFPVISIKGKAFTIVRDGDRKIVPNPKDPDSPATYLDVVLVKANRATSKVYYIKGYTEGSSDGAKPDCFSNDGTAPDPQSESPQSKACASCKHNVWGSKIGDNGQKSKACQDSVRMAVATADNLKEAYLLRVPPASIKALGEHGKLLKNRGVKYNMVVTRVSFEAEVATPKLLFKPIGFLPETAYASVVALGESDLVSGILGTDGFVPVEEGANPAEQAAAVEKAKEVVEQAAKPAKPAKPVQAAKADKPAPAAEPEIDLDSLNFDD